MTRAVKERYLVRIVCDGSTVDNDLTWIRACSVQADYARKGIEARIERDGPATDYRAQEAAAIEERD